MTKVCRLCLSRLQRGSKYFNINAVESFTGFMPYRDQLTTCIPEMALDLIPNPVICNNCRNALKSSCDFKSRCLLVEKKIRQYVESQPSENSTYNLAEIDTSSLPKSVKFEEIVHKESTRLLPILPKLDVSQAEANSSILSNLLTVSREDVILLNPSEIEITNVNVVTPPLTLKGKKSTNKQQEQSPTITYTPIEKDEHGLFSCNHCSKKFTNVPSLHNHKTKVHEEDYLCNFCNIPFKTLQNLRKHNQQCQKARGSPGSPAKPTSPSVLTKRPHLPTKAKNHLKRWLFNHTDHPYPTDVEKQQLMKETNLSLLQVENWFINARRRILADLTRLKNMRGGLFRGKRSRRGRGGRGRVDINTIEDDMFEPIFGDDHEETMAASRLWKDLDESDPSFLNPLEDSAEGENESLEMENNGETQENDSEDIESIIPQYNIANVENIVVQDDEIEEQDPLGDQISLSDLTSHIKMEADTDER